MSVTPVSRCGSSPHTRGALDVARDYRLVCRDHPRIRGEHTQVVRASRAPPGSSPHTRGARNELEANVNKTGIIPAYAGSTCTTSYGPFS